MLCSSGKIAKLELYLAALCGLSVIASSFSNVIVTSVKRVDSRKNEELLIKVGSTIYTKSNCQVFGQAFNIELLKNIDLSCDVKEHHMFYCEKRNSFFHDKYACDQLRSLQSDHQLAKILVVLGYTMRTFFTDKSVFSYLLFSTLFLSALYFSIRTLLYQQEVNLFTDLPLGREFFFVSERNLERFGGNSKYCLAKNLTSPILNEARSLEFLI